MTRDRPTASYGSQDSAAASTEDPGVAQFDVISEPLSRILTPASSIAEEQTMADDTTDSSGTVTPAESEILSRDPTMATDDETKSPNSVSFT